MQGAGGLEATVRESDGLTTGLLNDYQGNAVGTISSGTVSWNPARVNGYGPVRGIQAPVLSLSVSAAEASVWRGQRIEPTGLYWLGARYYDPVEGRFLSPDPLGHAASMDLYSFCSGDPVNRFDPTGRLGKGAHDNSIESQSSLGSGNESLGQNMAYESLLDDLYSPKVTLEGVVGGLANLAFGAVTLPFSMAEGTANGLTTMVDGTYENQYGLLQQASVGRRVWEGSMAAMTLIPVGEVFQGLRGIGTIGRGLSLADDFGVAAEGGLYSTTAGQGMESGLFGRIQSAFQRQGGVMQADADSTRLLNTLGVEGATADAKTILLPQNPSTSAVYEELIHSAQYRAGMTDPLQMEIEAAQKLIRFSDAYNIPAAETQQTINRLNSLLLQQGR
jgi:RHS repeat-associated protein